MSYMKTIKLLLVFCILISLQVVAQDNALNLKPVNFGDCEMTGFERQTEKEAAWKSETQSIADYLNKVIKDKQFKKVKKGKVILAIIVLPNGKPCCASFMNLTNRELNPYAFKDAVNSMPDWTPAQQGGKDVKALKMLVFDVKKKGKLSLSEAPK